LILGINSGQVAHFMAAFVESGVPIGMALDLLRGIVGNRRMSHAMGSVRSKVLEGDTLTHAFESERIFPPIVQRMVAVGEGSGALVTALRKIQVYYDRELPRRIQKIFGLAGPAATVVLGVVLLLVILAVLLPIYRLYSAINVVR
jgi:type II secretory pathway component PulF